GPRPGTGRERGDRSGFPQSGQGTDRVHRKGLPRSSAVIRGLGCQVSSPSGWHAFHHLRVTPTLNPVDENLKMQREALEALDRIDPLASLRDKFLLPPGVIYLVGNSLGALPRSTAARVSRGIEKEWGH